MSSLRQRTLRLGLLVLLLAGWGQRLCAEVGMACGPESEPAVAAEAGPSCHGVAEVPPRPPEPAPLEMGCCEPPDAVASTAAAITPPDELGRLSGDARLARDGGVTDTAALSRQPPPPDLLEVLCRLLI